MNKSTEMSATAEAASTVDLVFRTAKLSAFFFQLQMGTDGQVDSESCGLWPRIEAVGRAMRSGDGQATELERNARDLADQVPPKIAELTRTSAPRARAQPVLPGRNFDFKVPSIGGHGALVPFLLHDTLALDLTLYLGYNDSAFAPSLGDLSMLNPGRMLLPSAMKASIGQSLLLTLAPADGFITEVEEDGVRHATACASQVTGLSTEKVTSPLRSGRLLGGPLYEFELLETGPEASGALSLPCHLLVWFLTSKKSRCREGDTQANNYYYYPLLELLTSRAKILYARSTAGAIFEEAQARQSSIQERALAVGKMSEDEDTQLEALERHLKAFPKETIPQSRCLQSVHNQEATIRANRINYRSSLERLEAGATVVDDLHAFHAFGDEDAEHAEQQVASYLNFLKPSESFADRTIAHIQAQTNVLARRQMKRTEDRERTLERKISGVIAFFGIALTISTITATVGEEPVEEWLKSSRIQSLVANELWLSVGETAVHFTVGLVVAMLVFGVLSGGWMINRWVRRRGDPISTDSSKVGGNSKTPTDG